MLKLFGSYIDPAIPLKPHQAKAINQRAWKEWQRTPINSIALIVAIMTPMVFDDLPMNLIERVLHAPMMLKHLAFLLLYIPYLIALTWAFRHYRFAPLVYAELRSTGFDVCPKCGYWLRDLDETVVQCPECGCVRTPLASTTPTATEE